MTATALVSATMHGPERRSGEGGEDQRVLGHRLRHRLAAGDPGPDQLEHVAGVQARAGRALTGTAVAAAHVGDPEWLLLAAVGRHDLPGGDVDHLRAAAQLDRVGAVPDPDQCLGPRVVGRGDEQVADLLPGPGSDRRQVSRCCGVEPGEDLGEHVGQRRGDVRTGPRAHWPHHPKGCATRLSAIPPRDTPGSGGPRSPTGGAMSRRGIACSRDTTNQRVRGRSRQFVSCLRRCVSGLWAMVGSRPPGKCPISSVQVMSGLGVVLTNEHDTTHRQQLGKARREPCE